MTYEEAKEAIKLEGFTIESTLARMASFSQGIKKAQEALEKQIPNKPHLEGDGYWTCPNCYEKYEYNNELDCFEWCSSCGQRIDWR